MGQPRRRGDRYLVHSGGRGITRRKVRWLPVQFRRQSRQIGATSPLSILASPPAIARRTGPGMRVVAEEYIHMRLRFLWASKRRLWNLRQPDYRSRIHADPFICAYSQPVVMIQEPCTHAVQYAGQCAICGKDLSA